MGQMAQRFRRRLARTLDAEDRTVLVTWIIRALAVLAASATIGSAVRVFGVTSGLF